MRINSGETSGLFARNKSLISAETNLAPGLDNVLLRNHFMTPNSVASVLVSCS